jgi:hypothetical protein
MVAKKYQSPSGGLNAAGRAYFKRTEGSNLKAPVTGSEKRLPKKIFLCQNVWRKRCYG